MPNFPYKLHELLERVEEDEELRSIISWLPDGKTFKIHSQEGFEQRLLREYFPRQTQIKSFMRQLQYYDFENFGEGIFRHRCFLRGQRNLCGQIMHQLPTKNQKKSGKSTRPLKTRGRKKKTRKLDINDPTSAAVAAAAGLSASASAALPSSSTTQTASARPPSPQTSVGSGSDGSVSSESAHHSTNDEDLVVGSPQPDENKARPEHVVTMLPPQVTSSSSIPPSSPGLRGGFLSSLQASQVNTGNLQQQQQQQVQPIPSFSHQQGTVVPLHNNSMSTIPSPQQQSLSQQLIAQQNLFSAQQNHHVRTNNYLSGLQEELLLGSMLHNQRYLAMLQQQAHQQSQQQQQQQSQPHQFPINSIPGGMTTTQLQNAAMSLANSNNNSAVMPNHHHQQQKQQQQQQQQQPTYDLERLQADAISNHLRNVAALGGSSSNATTTTTASTTSSALPSGMQTREDERVSLKQQQQQGHTKKKKASPNYSPPPPNKKEC